ncbi:uncharacterized protein LOC116301253 [Actinia tenebrosa]|uniref:Uncharacterized protein LOC116301253 n=1 Tax=Actinia tenebrosa TaxID=6105 RepID=A0A6P8IHE8_ACTTE|nr:uncharacterized protein LOC116301253 [Actinia tenebrosa]
MEIKRFLCCLNVREGSIVCGIGTMVIGVLRLYFLWFNVAYLHRLTKTQIKDLPLPIETLSVIHKVQISITVFTLIVALLLLIGIWKHKKGLLIPWIAGIWTEELLDIGTVIFYIAKKVKMTASVYIGDSLFLLLNIYCILCVYSYFKQLKREDKKDQRPFYNLAAMPEESDEEFLIE